MSTQNPTQKAPEVLSPEDFSKLQAAVCPYCGDDPMTYTMKVAPVAETGAIVAEFWCANPKCRRMISFQFVGQVMTEEQRAAAHLYRGPGS